MFLILDDALEQSKFDLCVQEIENQFEQNANPEQNEFVKFTKRWYPTTHTLIPNTLEDLLWSNKIKDAVKDFPDLSWKWFMCNKASSFEVQVTLYEKPDDLYVWHVDHSSLEPNSNRRILNYILYLTEPEGGNLDITDDYTYKGEDLLNKSFPIGTSIKPKKNRLVIMPSWIPHRVNPVTSGKRLTINGHISL